MSTFNLGGHSFESGDFVTCEIDGRKISNARIFVYDENSAFICQNDMDGSISPDMLGFKYAWSINGRSSEVRNLRSAPVEYYPREQLSEYKSNLLTEDGDMLRVRG